MVWRSNCNLQSLLSIYIHKIMNTSAVQYPSEPWSRRCSIESIYSVQGKETDFVRDTSDTDALDDSDLEYEPFSAPEEDPPSLGETSQSDNEIIQTKIIEISVGTDGDLEFADSERTATDGSDSELELTDYGRCAQCGAKNNNPLYRYCQGCYKVRKSFFPPRPKRKHKRKLFDSVEARPHSQDSGFSSQASADRVSQELIELPGSQELIDRPGRQESINCANSQETSCPDSQELTDFPDSQVLTQPEPGSSVPTPIANNECSRPQRPLKRRAESVDRNTKRVKLTDIESDSDSEIDSQSVKPPIKTLSDPSLTVEDVITKKTINNNSNKKTDDDNMCIVCLSNPKSGVFAHGRIAHICCCYKCAVKVWTKAKRCPVCNCKVSNVLRAVVM